MTNKTDRLEIVDEGRKPDFEAARARAKDREDGLDPDEERRARRRAKYRERKKQEAATAETTPEFSIDLCHTVNRYVMLAAGTITRRAVEPTPEDYKALDASLQEIGRKYGAWLAKYAPEITYAVTAFLVVASSPRIAGEPIRVIVDDEKEKQNRSDLGPQG